MDKDRIARCLALSQLARGQQGEAQVATLAELEAALRGMQPAATPAPPGAELMLDYAGYLTGWNEGAEQLFGYRASEALGQHVLLLYADNDEDADVDEIVVDADHAVVDVRRRKKSGEVIRVRLNITLLRDLVGHPTGMRVLVTPVQEGLTQQERTWLHARIIEEGDQGVLITDAQQRIVSVNGAFTRITGYTALEALGKTPDLLRSGEPGADFPTRVKAAMHGSAPWRGEILGRRKNGELFPQAVTVSAVRGEDGAVTHTFSLFSDISVHKDAEERMQRLANYDTLTGLPNLGLLLQLLGQAMMEARRKQEHGALLVVEVNRLGAISDTLGHEVSNSVLVEVGRIFRMALRDEDILARLDGAKFAAALPQIEKREHAAIVAQKLIAALDAPLNVGSHSLQLGAHIGVAVYPEDAPDASELVRGAEAAMSRVMPGQAPAMLFYSEEMNQRAKEHLRIENELRQALANDELLLYYQPKVSLRSGRIVGAEALLRWRHPVRGLVAPGVFIPVAEETGLILELGNWVLDEACRQIAAWRDANLMMPPIAVNLSARQFDEKLPQHVAGVLARHQVHPEQLMLEITESLLVGGTDNVIAIMNGLVAMGLSLALDDFGTGYSSLAYLKKFPISTLKIDRAFVVGLPFEENDCAIARAIVTMAKQLRQEIVAEGVETIEQMSFLRDLGCDQLQGYLFSQPVGAADFERMLREGKRLAVTGRQATLAL